MQLGPLLGRCRQLEERAAALYRSYAARARGDSALEALWTDLAREEAQHARSLTAAEGRLDAVEHWRTRVDGWQRALAEVEERLEAAERLGADATADQHLRTALELEMTELEALRHALMAAAHAAGSEDVSGEHTSRLAEHAKQRSADPQVQLAASVLLARSRLQEDAG